MQKSVRMAQIVCNKRKILWGWFNQVRLGKRDVWDWREIQEIHTKIFNGNSETPIRWLNYNIKQDLYGNRRRQCAIDSYCSGQKRGKDCSKQRYNFLSVVFFLFGWIPGDWILCHDVSEHCSIFIGAYTTYENGTHRVFRKFSI
jgi:hypothetical protein